MVLQRQNVKRRNINTEAFLKMKILSVQANAIL